MFSILSWVIHLPIGCRHPFIRYWQPLMAKTTATCSLPHPVNKRQQSVNSFGLYVFHNQGIVWIFMCITVLSTALIGKNTIYQRGNTDTKLIDIANCISCKSALLVTENTILKRYNLQTANARALSESRAGPTGRPGDNLPNSDWLGVYHGIISEWTARASWRAGQPIWQRGGLDPDPDTN